MSPNPATRNFNHLLFQVAEKTFGELAFLLVKPDELVPARRSSCPVWAYVARVEFIGPFGGEMQLGITEDLLHPLATNMLGIEENEEWPEGVIREDALTELLNVTCGNLLPMIAGDQAVFHIGEPGVIPQFLPPPPEKYALAGRIVLHLDIGAACLACYADSCANIVETTEHESRTEASQ